MDRVDVNTLDFYDRTVTKYIVEKYGLPEKAALRGFVSSQVYQMLANPKLKMWEFSPIGIFDMWETEQITGDLQNSSYLRRN